MVNIQLRQIIYIAILLFVCLQTGILWAESASWNPGGKKISSKKIICPITRDTFISSIGNEKYGNNGGARKLKLKGFQEYILLDIDPEPLKGKIITGALLHLRSASPRKAPLARVGISTLASQWTEGTGFRYRAQPGSACFHQASYRVRDWAYPGSTLMDVVFGRGHTLWKFADCSPPDVQNWQTVAVEPDVIAARVAGISYGFCVYDEVGNIWSLKNGNFKYTTLPNRFCYSTETWRSDPRMEIWVRDADTLAPNPVQSLMVETEGFPAGEAMVRWRTPVDNGRGKVLGFHITCKRDQQEYPVPRYLIPLAGKPGEDVRMHLRDMDFQPGEQIELCIMPVDNAGNIGEAFTQNLSLSKGKKFPDIPEANIRPFPLCRELPRVGNYNVSVTDLSDKIDPVSGKMIPEHPEGYKGGNHLFSARTKTVRLQAARNETVCFQVNLHLVPRLEPGNKMSLNEASPVIFEYAFDQEPGLKPKIYQFAYVRVSDDKGKIVSVLPDPLIPVKSETWNRFNIQMPENISDARFPISNFSVICELYIPHSISSGQKKGTLKIFSGSETLELAADLQVWNFTLPNKLSFIPEMNAYGTVSPHTGYEYYRLAHEHRACMNRVPYGWRGIPRFAPGWTGQDFDWDEWDKHVAPLLDGTAFEDLPRKGEPLDMFYLPISENYPICIFDHYTPSYWADEALEQQYAAKLKTAFAAFARHCETKKWYDTIFQFYLNNKVYYRKSDSKSSAPWNFDEPMNIQDFWALRWYGMLWHEAVSPIIRQAQLWYRGDISYTEFGRNILWGVTDVEYVDTDFNKSQKIRMKQDEQHLSPRQTYFAEYGSVNKIHQSNTQPICWCVSAWSKGATGVMPWQTIGTRKSWNIAEQNALFYPHPRGPRASVRLKAFTRGQQDVEYLELFCNAYQVPRFAAAAWLEHQIDLKGRIHKASEMDAGTIVFDRENTTALWKLRYCLGKAISEKAPAYKRALVHRRVSQWDMKKLPDMGYVSPAPDIPSYKPACDTFTP